MVGPKKIVGQILLGVGYWFDKMADGKKQEKEKQACISAKTHLADISTPKGSKCALNPSLRQ